MLLLLNSASEADVKPETLLRVMDPERAKRLWLHGTSYGSQSAMHPTGNDPRSRGLFLAKGAHAPPAQGPPEALISLSSAQSAEKARQGRHLRISLAHSLYPLRDSACGQSSHGPRMLRGSEDGAGGPAPREGVPCP